jgi:predicted PurR-regulated permease PerM
MLQDFPPVTAVNDRHQPTEEPTQDNAARVALIERSILVLLVVGLFTTAILFGAALATAAWPMRQALVRRGFGHGTAAALLLLLSIVIVVLPMLLFAPNLADQIVRGTQRVQAYFAATPEQPAWIKAVPLLGRRLGVAWDRIVEVKGNLRALLEPYTANLEQVMIGAARALADSLL